MLGRHPPRPEAGRGRGLAGHDRLLPERRLRGGRVGAQGGLGLERAERHGTGNQFNQKIGLEKKSHELWLEISLMLSSVDRNVGFFKINR